MNIRLRRKRSPSLPPSRINAADVSTYASIVHCRVSGVVCSSRWSDGRATFTIVLSSMDMNCAKHIATNVHRSRFARRWAALRPVTAAPQLGPRTALTTPSARRSKLS
jgi:hypothetical protein